jgi:hypothetical protein
VILSISSSIDYDPWEKNSQLIQEVGKLKRTDINNHKEVIRLAICLYGMIIIGRFINIGKGSKHNGYGKKKV